MSVLAWLAVLLGGAFLGCAVVRAVRLEARKQPPRRRHLGKISDSWTGFERQEEARRVDALRHRP